MSQSLKKKKGKKKKTKTQYYQKINKMKQTPPKQTNQPCSPRNVGQMLLDMALNLEHGWHTYSVTLHWRKLIFLFLTVSIANNMLRSGTWCPSFLLSAGTSSGLNLCRLCARCHSLSFPCTGLAASRRCCFCGVIHHLNFLQSFCLYFCIDP